MQIDELLSSWTPSIHPTLVLMLNMLRDSIYFHYTALLSRNLDGLHYFSLCWPLVQCSNANTKNRNKTEQTITQAIKWLTVARFNTNSMIDETQSNQTFCFARKFSTTQSFHTKGSDKLTAITLSMYILWIIQKFRPRLQCLLSFSSANLMSPSHLSGCDWHLKRIYIYWKSFQL